MIAILQHPERSSQPLRLQKITEGFVAASLSSVSTAPGVQHRQKLTWIGANARVLALQGLEVPHVCGFKVGSRRAGSAEPWGAWGRGTGLGGRGWGQGGRGTGGRRGQRRATATWLHFRRGQGSRCACCAATASTGHAKRVAAVVRFTQVAQQMNLKRSVWCGGARGHDGQPRLLSVGGACHP